MKHQNTAVFLSLAAFLLDVSLSVSEPLLQSRPSRTLPGYGALRVVDGDTLAHDAPHLRLYGVDTPEKRQPYGPEAQACLVAILAAHAIESIEYVGYDSNNCRPIVRVWLAGVLPRQDVSLLLVQQGCAWWYEQYAPTDTMLRLAQQQAREARLGVWALPQEQQIPPWEWRKQH